MTTSQIPVAIPLLVILALATLLDWREQRIPNVLTFGSAIFALVLHTTLDGASGAWFAVGGWVAGLICFLPFYARGGMAAGDVKLMAAVGAFVGPMAGLVACMLSLVAGGIIALMTLALVWGSARLSPVDSDSEIDMRSALRKRIPYAGAIAAGSSVVVLVPAIVPPALFTFGA